MNNMPIAPINQDQLDELTQAWSKMIGCICHDLTTPLATIHMTSSILKKILPHLLQGYKLAVQHNLLPENTVDKKHVKILETDFFYCIDSQIKKIQEFLRLLDPYNKQLLSTDPNHTSLSIKNTLNSVLKKYRFENNQERDRVHVNCNEDFQFYCAPLFIECLLSNLLSNALRAIETTSKREINIWTEQTQSYHLLHFKDTGTGMSDSSVASVFNRFFCQRENNILPGLGFCRLALLESGGDVICHSLPEEYTTFTIQFKKMS